MNGLEKRSEVMIDKIQTIPVDKIGGEIGRASDEEMLAINRALAIFWGLPNQRAAWQGFQRLPQDDLRVLHWLVS